MGTNTVIETELEVGDLSAADVALLADLVAEDTPVARRGPKVTVDVASMTKEQRLRHNANLRKSRYAEKRALMAAGKLKFDEATVRDALADAALMILGSGTAGTDSIMAYLEKVFSDKVGVPFTVRAEARSGSLKPKLLGFAKTAS